MKRKNNRDISILLYALLLFSFGIGWVYSRNTRQKDSINNKIETLVDTPDVIQKPEKEAEPSYAKASEGMPEKKIEEAKPVESEKETKAKPVEAKPVEGEKEAAKTEPKKETEAKPVLRQAQDERDELEKAKEAKPIEAQKATKTEGAKPEETPKAQEPEPKKETKAKPVESEKETKAKPVEAKPVEGEKEAAKTEPKKETEAKPLESEKEAKAKPGESEKETKAKPVEAKPVESEKEAKPVESKKKEEPKPTESTIKIPQMPKPPEEVVFDPKSMKDEEITVNTMLSYSKTLIRSGSINHLIRILKLKCPKKIIVETINKIIQNGDLSRPQKLKIILSLGKYYEKDKKIQAQIFDIISNAANKKYIEIGKTPLLFAAIQVKEEKAIPALVEWYTKNDKHELNLVKEALNYAAKNDFGQELKKFNENGVKIDPKYATELLWINLNANKTSAASNLIETLKNLGANLNSTCPETLKEPKVKNGSNGDKGPKDPEAKFTALIKAIKNKNLEAVKKLLQFGADPKLRSEDKAIGYPLQIARELKLLEIEDALRAHGARD